jgi:hypothetical protein
MTETTAPPVRLVLGGHAHLLRLARLVGAGMASDLDLDVEQLADVRLAIGEAGALCLQLGARSLTYELGLDGRTLVVDLTASVPASEIDRAGDLDLTRQILAVACSTVETAGDGDHVSIRMTFDAPN